MRPRKYCHSRLWRRTGHGKHNCYPRRASHLIHGHALHEKGLQRQLGQQPGTKSARGPVDKSRVNCWFCSPVGLHRVIFGRASGGVFNTVVFDGRGRKKDDCFLGDQTRRHPTLPRPAPPRRPPCAGPPRPIRGMSGLWIRQVNLLRTRHSAL